MRRFFNIAALVVAAMAVLATSCKKDAPVTPADDTKTPTIELNVFNILDNQIEFTITTTDAEEAYYHIVEGAEAVAAETIKSEGTKVVNESYVTGGLEPSTEYTLHVLAVNGTKQATAKETFTTLAQGEEPEEFDGVELNKLVSAVYRNDNSALAGNYEFTFGNTTELGWDGDIQVFIDFYNVEDSDPLNALLPNGVYEPNSDYSPFTYDPSSSYVDIVVDGEVVTSPILGTV